MVDKIKRFAELTQGEVTHFCQLGEHAYALTAEFINIEHAQVFLQAMRDEFGALVKLSSFCHPKNDDYGVGVKLALAA